MPGNHNKRKEKMIWSCEIDYYGWEDDIHHHHFFIESDTKPTEEQVAQHYNWNHFVARGDGENDDWFGHNWIRKDLPSERYSPDDAAAWVALYNDGSGTSEYLNVTITIKPLKVETLDDDNT